MPLVVSAGEAADAATEPSPADVGGGEGVAGVADEEGGALCGFVEVCNEALSFQCLCMCLCVCVSVCVCVWARAHVWGVGVHAGRGGGGGGKACCPI